mmetsp:Transcript_3538/g.6903  ORF Transcript_3538/g.6903 Transcript_3538/m.6903 type:complete len:267 (+) Transcript_3538:488-1288(+)
MVDVCQEAAKAHPQPTADKVRIEEERKERRPNEPRQEIANSMFDMCCIRTGERHRCLELMVLFVDLFIETLGVQDPVSRVKEHLPRKQVETQLSHQSPAARQRCAGQLFSPTLQQLNFEPARNYCNYQRAQLELQHVQQHPANLRRRLPYARLDLPTSNELWPQSLHNDEGQATTPVANNLDQNSAHCEQLDACEARQQKVPQLPRLRLLLGKCKAFLSVFQLNWGCFRQLVLTGSTLGRTFKFGLHNHVCSSRGQALDDAAVAGE